MTPVFIIIGASGLIGKAITHELNGQYEWFGTTCSKVNSNMLHLDITNQREVSNIFNKIKPTHIINCVNLKGGVDFCERNPELAQKIHYEGTTNIAKECLKHNAKFLYISSECVFDGKKESYAE